MNRTRSRNALMNRVLTAATLIPLIIVSPLTLAAGDRAAQVEQRIEESRTRLELSDGQLDQMAPVLEKSMAAQQRILSSYGIDLESRSGSGKLGLRQARAMRQALEAVRAETLDELKGILNDEQLDEFKRMQQERKAEMQQRLRDSSRRSQRQTSPATGLGLSRRM